MKSYLAILLLLSTHSSTMNASDKKQEGKDLLERAEMKSDIFQLPSFEMKAKLTILNKDQFVDGSYTFLWNGKDQWREEITFPNYNEIRVGNNDRVFTKRSTDFMPVQIHQLNLTLSYGRRIAPGSEEKVKEIHERTVNGLKVSCVLLENDENGKREVCIDKATDGVVRQTPFLDSELTPVVAKLFPHVLSYIENGKPIARVEVTELKANDPFPLATFEPPLGAVSKPGCWNPELGHLVKRVNPSYPDWERRSHAQGTVAIYGVIAPDGGLRDLRVLSGGTPGLNRASLDALQQWRYKPYMCNGTPVEVETVVFFNFSVNSLTSF